MTKLILSRRTLAATLAAFALSGPAAAQDEVEASQWMRAVTVTWAEIARVPTDALTRSVFPLYGVASDEAELERARRTARENRDAWNAEITRCRAMVEALGPAPQIGGEAAQAIVDQIAPDQRQCLDRLSVLGEFLETTAMRFVAGEMPFTPAMRIINYALFGEIDWIMASATKATRLAFEPDSFRDIVTRLLRLDFLVSSTVRGVLVKILQDEPRDHIVPAQNVLRGAAVEFRHVGERFAAADRLVIDVPPEARQEVRQLLPRLRVLAAEHATRLEATADTWTTLTAAQLLAREDADLPPSFSAEAGALLRGASVPL